MRRLYSGVYTLPCVSSSGSHDDVCIIGGHAGKVYHLHVFAVKVVDLSTASNLVDVCLQETGGLGVNCIIDNGGMKWFVVTMWV